MYLLLFTIVYCIATQMLDLSYDLAFGIFIIIFGFLKGFMSNEFNEFLNLKNTKILYQKIGFKKTATEILSLILVYVNAIIIDYEPLKLFEMIVLSGGFIILFRFLFWGITNTVIGNQ